MSAAWTRLFLLLASCRHISTKTPGPTAAPQVPISPLPTERRSAVLKGESLTEKVELLNPVSLTLECTWAGDQDKNPNITGLWRKDGDEVESSRLTVPLENGQYNLKRVFNIVTEENLGCYSCVFGSKAKIDFVLAAPQIGEVRDKPIVSYVGDSVVIACKMEESKPKPNTWRWYKENGTDKARSEPWPEVVRMILVSPGELPGIQFCEEQISTAAEPHRYEIKTEERKTKLLVHNLTKADSGLYYCGAVYAISTAMSHVELKVISFQEPLKPFIAIVVEVIILVAAILLYERSQSKKNHTAGNGTSDQSNTVTQGENSGAEESSSMRQRRV